MSTIEMHHNESDVFPKRNGAPKSCARHGSPSGARVAVRARRARADLAAWRGAGGPPRQGGGGLSLKGALRVQPGARHATPRRSTPPRAHVHARAPRPRAPIRRAADGAARHCRLRALRQRRREQR